MEEKKKSWAEQVKDTVYEMEMQAVQLGIEIGALKNTYYYHDIIAVLKGTAQKSEDMYFGKLKPLYDKYGYEKVNRILLALEETEQGGEANE
jgi:hypothetical protein